MMFAKDKHNHQKGQKNMNILRDELSHICYRIQGSLLPWLAEEVGPLTEKGTSGRKTYEFSIWRAFLIPRWSRSLFCAIKKGNHFAIGSSVNVFLG
jgi:hypothetical protein